MADSDFLRLADRSAKDVAQGYADDEVNGGVVPVPEEMNKYGNGVDCVTLKAVFFSHFCPCKREILPM